MSALAFNPEIIRNARIQLRRGRMMAVVAVCAVASLTAVVYLMDSQNIHVDKIEEASNLFKTLLGLQTVVLSVGGGIYCLQSVHREKDLNTFDYQRITRLTPLELAVGKVFGAPILTYFIFLCLMPVALWTAIQARLSVSNLLEIYVTVLLGSIFFHGFALLISLFLGRGASAGGILFYLMAVWMSVFDFNEYGTAFAIHPVSPFFAFDFIPVAAKDQARMVYRPSPWEALHDTFFGVQISHFWVLVVLFLTLLAWFFLAAARNIKRDPTVYEVYSPAQGFMFALYLNLLVLGFFRWMVPQYRYNQARQFSYTEFVPIRYDVAEGTYLVLSLCIFGILGFVLFRNRDRVRRRIRELGAKAAGWGAALWPAQYLLVGTVLSGLAIVWLIQRRLQPASYWNPGVGVLEVGFIALWLVRDILYLQWMNMRRVRRPLVTAVIYMAVFYICTVSLYAPLGWYSSENTSYASIFVPAYAFRLNPTLWVSASRAWILSLVLLFSQSFIFVWLQRRELYKMLSFAPQS